MTSPGTFLKSRALRVSNVNPWLRAIDAMRKSIVALRTLRDEAVKNKRPALASNGETTAVYLANADEDAIEHPIAPG